MLLHVGETEERSAPDSAQTFCLKTAVIECLKSPNARQTDMSLELDKLKRMLVDKYFHELSSEKGEERRSQPQTSQDSQAVRQLSD